MSKATLEFTLPEDSIDFELAVEGTKWWMIVHTMDQWLRGQIKYAPDDIDEVTLACYERCREELRELITDSGLNIDK